MGSTNWQSVIRFENSEQYSDKLQFPFIEKIVPTFSLLNCANSAAGLAELMHPSAASLAVMSSCKKAKYLLQITITSK
jgi:hypothetical protein